MIPDELDIDADTAAQEAELLATYQARHQRECDERCHGCFECYKRTGDTICTKLCEHASLEDYE